MVRQILLAIVAVMILGVVLFGTLKASNDFTDNLYNLGVIRRSARPSAQYPLETSFTHWYFRAENVVRAEDWHRGLSLLLVRTIARYVSQDEVVLRIPHLFWVLALWVICLWTLQLLRRDLPRSGFSVSLVPMFFPILLTILLLVTPPFPGALSAAFLDDIPAAVFVLAGINLLVGSTSLRAVFVAGAFFGVAFWMKDMALLWVASAPLFLVLALIERPDTKRRSYWMRRMVVLTLPCALIVGAKMTWNYRELGTLIPHAVSQAVSARLITGISDPEHALYCVTRPAPLDTVSLIHGGPRALALRLHRGFEDTVTALLRLSPAWILLTLGILGSLVGHRTGGMTLRLYRVTGMSILVLLSVCLVYLVEPTQLRYWIVPVALSLTLGVAGLESFPWAQWRQCESSLLVGFLLVMLAGGVMVYSARLAIHGLSRTAFRPYREEAVREVEHYLRPGQSVMVNTNRGAGFWSKHPSYRVVGIRPWVVGNLDPSQMQRFLKMYHVGAALLGSRRDAPTIKLLKRSGFALVAQFGKDVVLVPAALARTGEDLGGIWKSRHCQGASVAVFDHGVSAAGGLHVSRSRSPVLGRATQRMTRHSAVLRRPS